MQPNPKLKRILRVLEYRLVHKWRKPHPVCSALNQLTIEFRSTSKIGEEIFANSFERRERAVLSKIIGKGDCVVDVGANVGFFTCLFALSVGRTGTVIAIEPTPTVYSILEKNVQRNNLAAIVQCRNMALSIQDGHSIMTCFPDGNEVYNSLGASIPVDRAVLPEKQIEVAVTTLDAILDSLSRENEGRSVFIKIDVEGFEQHVLSGGAEALMRARNCALMVELYEPAARQCGSSTRESVNFLRMRGFVPLSVLDGGTLQEMHDTHIVALSEGKLECPNVFFLKGEFIDRARRESVVK